MEVIDDLHKKLFQQIGENESLGELQQRTERIKDLLFVFLTRKCSRAQVRTFIFFSMPLSLLAAFYDNVEGMTVAFPTCWRSCPYSHL